MGQKINPIGLRVGINRTWDSRWFASRDYATLLHQDLKLRNHLLSSLQQAGCAKVIIERPAKRARITIHAARPGVVIGRKGQDIEKLRLDLVKLATDPGRHRRQELDLCLLIQDDREFQRAVPEVRLIERVEDEAEEREDTHERQANALSSGAIQSSKMVSSETQKSLQTLENNHQRPQVSISGEELEIDSYSLCPEVVQRPAPRKMTKEHSARMRVTSIILN